MIKFVDYKHRIIIMNPEKFNVLFKFLEKMVEDEEDLQCKYCLESFPNAEQLKTHSITVHIDNRFICDFCFREVKTQNGLVMHIRHMHMYIPPYTEFKKNKLPIIKEKEEDYKPDTDSGSEESLYDEYDDLGRRMKKPEREYPRQCDHCSYVILKKNTHYHHYLFMHNDILDQYPYKTNKVTCPICSTRMVKSSIEAHIANHDKYAKVKCPVCNKTLKNRNIMLAHKRIVHGGKRYICHYCTKEFKTREDITRHIRIHTGDKPFKCHICGAGFAHSGNRNLHIRTKHGNAKISAESSTQKNKGNDSLKKTKFKKNERKQKFLRVPKKKKSCSKDESDEETLSVIKRNKYKNSLT